MAIKRYFDNVSVIKAHNKNSNLLGANNDIDAINIWINNLNNSNTIRNYRYIVERFYTWLQVFNYGISLSELKTQHIQEYKDFLKSPDINWCGPAKSKCNENWKPFVKGLSNSSIQTQIRVIKTLLKYLYDAGYIEFNIAALIRNRDRVNNTITHEKYLTIDEFANVIRTLELLHPVDHVRYTFVLKLMFYTGLRRTEVAHAMMSDIIVIRNQWWIKVNGKGDKYGEIPIPTQLFTELQKYRKYHHLPEIPSPQDKYTPLVIKSTKNSTRYSSNGIYKFIQRIFRYVAKHNSSLALRLSMISCHALRHSYATAQCDLGVDIRIIKENMRHSQLQTTMRYLHVRDNTRYIATVNGFGKNCA